MAEKLNGAHDAASNVTDKTRLEFYKKALSAKQALEEVQAVASSANGVYRGVLKSAKKAGVCESVIVQLLAERHQDQAEITARQQEYIRFRILTGVYTPTKQADIFADARKGEGIDAAKAYDDGVLAGAHGENRQNNKHAPGSEEYDAWDRGWIAGQKQIVRKMKQPPPRVPRKGKVGAEAGAVN